MSSIVRGFFSRSAACAAVGFVALLAAAPARAEVIYGNTFDPVSENTNTVSGSTQFATGFTTGASTLPIVSIDLGIGVPSGSVSPIVSLFAGSGSAPTGPALATFTTLSTVTGSSQSVYTFTPTAPVSVNPSSSYFVVVSAGPGESFRWFQAASNPAGQNASGWTFLAGARSTTGGASYNPNGGAGLGYISVVPEPSTLALAGCGLATLAGFELRRRSRRNGTSRN